jgi:hypothetical protein
MAIDEGSVVAHNALELFCYSKVPTGPGEDVSKHFSKKRLCSRLRADALKMVRLDNWSTLEKLITKALRKDPGSMLEIGQKYYTGKDLIKIKILGSGGCLKELKADLLKHSTLLLACTRMVISLDKTTIVPAFGLGEPQRKVTPFPNISLGGYIIKDLALEKTRWRLASGIRLLQKKMMLIPYPGLRGCIIKKLALEKIHRRLVKGIFLP